MDAIAVGPFTLKHPLGRGGMGEVWLAEHARQGVRIAVKVLTASGARDPRYQAAFRNEVRAVARLLHPNVVTVLDAGEIDEAAEIASGGRLVGGSPWLAMELASGVLGRAPWPTLRPIVLGLLDALAHAHARGVLHRDIKPANVLLADGRPKLTDFGLAHAMHASGPSSAFAVAGTPAFMPPEQQAGRWRDFGPWTDLYAVGALVLDALTGSPEGSARRAVLVPGVPRDLAAWLERLMAPAIGARYASAAEARAALEALELGASASFATPPDAARRTWLDVGDADDGPGSPPPRSVAAIPDVPGEEPEIPSSTVLHGVGIGLFGLRTLPLVGRERERLALWDALRQAATGRPVMRALHGPDGTGKTRLATWLVERAAELDVARGLFATWAPDPDRSDGLLPMLRRHLVLDGLDATDTALRLEAVLPDLDAEDREALAELLATPGTQLREPERHRLIVAAIEALAVSRPVIVVLDDAHRDPEALRFAGRLSRCAAPILVLHVTDDDAHDETIEIEPLDADESAALVDGLLGLERELAVQVAERTAGNPRFLFHLVGDWIDRGVLELGPRGFRLRAGVQLELPDDLHAVWTERIERILSGADERSIELAAALGLSVDAAEWRAACGHAGLPPALDLVERLVRRNLATTGPEGPERSWAFAHPVVREALIRRADAAGRLSQHHAACAATLSELRGIGISRRWARHLMALGRWADATAPLDLAAREASGRGSYAAADALCADHARAMDRIGASPDDPRRLRGRITFAIAAWCTGQNEAAEQVLLDVCARASAAGHVPEHTEALLDLARLDRHRGAIGRAAERLDEAARLCEGLAMPELAARVAWDRAQLEMSRGHWQDAIARYEVARGRYERIGNANAALVCSKQIGMMLAELGHVDEGEAAVLAARAACERIGSRIGLADCENDLGLMAFVRGDPRTAAGRFREAARRFRTLGSVSAWLASYNLAIAELCCKDAAAAEATATTTLREAERLGWERTVLGLQLVLAGCAALRGDAEACDAALAIVEQRPPDRDPDIASVARTLTAYAREAGLSSIADRAARLAAAYRTRE